MRLPPAIIAVISLVVPVQAAQTSGAKSGTKPPAKQPAEEKAGSRAKTKAAEETAAFAAREALAKLQAMDIFPEMEKDDSEFAKAVSAEVESLESESPAFFRSSAWPLLVARKVAASLGVKPRTIGEIRKRIAEDFEVDAAAFQQIHGLRITAARLKIGDEMIEVAAQLAKRVTADGLAVDCDTSLVVALADVSQFEKSNGESQADYWKRQRRLLAAVGEARPGQETLQITFEFHSETLTAAAKSGERLVISEDGKVTLSKIAPAARMVRATDPVAAPVSPPRKSKEDRPAKK